MRDGEVNHPSIEPSGLTSTREIMPHATSQEDKVWGRSDWGDMRGERELWQYAEWVIAERKESNLRSWSLENKDIVSQHRGLSSGWLVVNPLGFPEPTVGWKRAPLLVVA
jgi:hypothetical protein